MWFGRRMALLLLLLLLLLSSGAQAQSGDGDGDMDTEPRVKCWSHITTEQSRLTCWLVAGGNRNEDDEDNDEDDSIEKMSLCWSDWSLERVERVECVKAAGDTISVKETPVVLFNLTVHLKKGGKITTPIDLKKIVKPLSPQVWNVTFNHESNQAVIHIRTPYDKDYLKVDNQRFQLQIWTTDSEIVLNQTILSENILKIDMSGLQKATKYHVRARAMPAKFLQGSWSNWSETFSFRTPAGETETDDGQEALYKLSVCLIPLVVVTFSVVFFWKNKISTYMWPSIPHPKDTLVQICKPNKGLLLNFKPEVFSALKVYPMEKSEVQPCEETVPSISPAAAADGTQSSDPCSTQSSDCRSTTSVSTEELELSALLSRTSSNGEDSLQSASPSPTNALQLRDRAHTPPPERSGGGNKAEVFGVSQQEEAYVTMSSFYQIK